MPAKSKNKKTTTKAKKTTTAKKKKPAAKKPAAAAGTAGPFFTKELFRFIEELADNNNRDWFNANKSRYEEYVKDAGMRFITAVSAPLGRISQHIIADARPSGGSMFRIYRDTRFSKDKSPYKTHVGIQFRHAVGKDVHAPGFYLHLAPDECFFGAGLWRPDTKTAARIRDGIAEGAKAYTRVLAAKTFASRFHLAGDSLKRPPRGFDPDHPLIDHLKRKDFIAVADLTRSAATSKDFLDKFIADVKAVAPLMKFLCGTLDLPW